MKPIEPTGRLDSVDALRGLDMFFITGGSALIHAVAKALPCGFTEFLDGQMAHMPWNGFTFYDMIFPLFLFIAGISFPFSIARKRERGLSERAIVCDILRRMALLILLGWIFNGLFRLDFEKMRYVSVLGRIGVAWGIAALIYRKSTVAIRLGIGAAVLILYGAATALIAAPDAPAGSAPLSIEGNIVGYIDRMLLPGRLLDGTFDPLGLLSTLPAVVTALLGMTAGDMVRNGRLTPQRRAGYLTIFGVVLVVLGLALHPLLPINKPLWSSSYVCFSGGFSALLFALFYGIIDLCGYKGWSLYFRVIGLNAITIYMLQKIVNLGSIRDFFFGGLAGLVPDEWKKTVLAVGYLIVCYIILKFLYNKKIFLKV